MKAARLLPLFLAVGISILGGVYLAERTEPDASAQVANHKLKPAILEAAHATSETPSPSKEQSDSASPSPLFVTNSWTVQPPNLTPLAPGEPLANRLVRATASIKRESLPVLSQLKKGDHVTIPLRDGTQVHGTVNLVAPDAQGWVRVGGSLQDSAKGGFTLSQRGTVFGGIIKTPAKDKAFLIDTSDKGLITMSEKPLNSVECRGYRKKPATDAEKAAAASSTNTIETIGSIPVPALDSLPAATAVLYLDFDGEVVTDPYWNNGYTINAQPVVLGTTKISPAQITDVWNRVVEDFRPFNISVTTIRDRYDNAPVGHRMRCIVTSTYYWEPDAGGIAGLHTFAEAGGSYYSSDVPCWAFISSYYKTADISGTISHEAGHTFGLSHDSLFTTPTSHVLKDEYFAGHGKWAPIMGTTYDHPISQWSICEYANGGNYDYHDYTDPNTIFYFKEDDTAIISNTANAFGYLPDDASSFAGDTILPNTGIFNRTGIIGTPSDIDAYTFTTRGGPTVINVSPAAIEPDLDVQFDLKDSTGTNVVPTVNPTGNLAASLTRTLAAGTYTIFIRSAGDGIPATTGYSTYGSIGQYNISGTFPAVPDSVPTITVDPVSQTVAQGAKTVLSVTATSNIPLTYAWQLDGHPIPGATSATYTITSTQPNHEGSYVCIVSNSIDSTPSQPALLKLNFKPIIKTAPVASIVGAGGSTPLSVSVVAIGTPPLLYQWQKNNVNIPSATSDTFTVNSPQFADGATYRCIISNTFGSVTSTGALVKVTSEPVITTDLPSSKGVPLGGSATLSITAVGTPTLSYQWFKGSAAIPGATKTSLTLSAIKATTADTYRCEVKNTVNAVTTTKDSTHCVVSVGNAPKITTQPISPAAIAVGGNINLSVVASGDATLNYQWQHDGINIPGATNAAFAVTGVAWADHGIYRCIVTNDFGTVTSTNANVTVNSSPIIVSSPVSRKIAKGAKTVLTVVATGSPTLKYVWRRDGTPVAGTAASLTVVGTSTADYDCVVSNSYGTAPPTTAAKVTVEDAPKITALPASQLAPLAGTYTLVTTVTGTPNLTFVWKHNNLPLSSQTASTLQLTNIQASDAGSYTLTVTNDVGTAVSTTMKLAVQTPPSITVPPLDQTAYAYQNVTFTATAVGSPTLTYQWTKDGIDIPKATTNKLALTSVQAAPSARYAVRVKNAVGTATSTAATLTILPAIAPTLASFAPTQGNVGHYTLLTGANLNWTTSVTMQKATTGTVNATFTILSPSELLVTIPTGVALLSPITVNTRGGTVVTAGSFLTRTGPTNDLFVDARLVPSIGGVLTGTMPNTFTVETDEPRHAWPGSVSTDLLPAYSAWHTFTPSVSGTYSVSTSGSKFDTRVAIYTGTSVGALTDIASNDDDDAGSSIYTSYTRFEAVAGTTYHIAVDGYNYTYTDPVYGDIPVNEYGNYILTVTRMAFSIPKAPR